MGGEAGEMVYGEPRGTGHKRKTTNRPQNKPKGKKSNPEKKTKKHGRRFGLGGEGDSCGGGKGQ